MTRTVGTHRSVHYTSRMHFRRAAFLFTIASCLAQLAIAQTASERLEAVRRDPLRLRQFLEALPKGGDLHNHLSGDVYAESFMQWAADDGFCVDKTNKALVQKCEGDNMVPAATALTQGVYGQMLDALSMRQFRDTNESGHDHFFATFGKFGAVSRQHASEMLVEAVQRFGSENVDYMEIIYAADRGAASRLGSDLTKGADFKSMRDQLLAGTALKAVLADSRRSLDEADAAVKTELHCGQADAKAGCNVDYRFLDEVHRGIPRENLFAELVHGFELASVDPRIVGINPVMPEDGYLSMTQFRDLMAMFAFLRPLYPTVKVSTHAGELAPGLVPPEGLRFHIRDSVEIAKAERIGHGVDIAYETNAPQLLREMAKRHVAVEICLTSNDVILGIRGKQHPLPMYMRAGVPVSLASDDPGVSRADLTTEFQRAVTEFGLQYADVKKMIRNSIEYSFLEGASLFVDHDYTRRACTTSCDAYLAKNAKARVQWKVEQRLRAFEQ
jgi:adenosine deaminase